jgi:hypothetical protein
MKDFFIVRQGREGLDRYVTFLADRLSCRGHPENMTFHVTPEQFKEVIWQYTTPSGSDFGDYAGCVPKNLPDTALKSLEIMTVGGVVTVLPDGKA